MSAFTVTLGSIIPGFIPGPFRPPNWVKPQKTSITCTLPAVNTTPGVTPAAQSATTYFFDAVMRVEHVQELVCTEHPVQVGPAIVDHAYLRPARVVLEFGMSDALAAYKNGQYTSNNSKSISAYQTFKQIQAARVPIILATRLDTYQNMILDDVRATDDNRTVQGLRGTLYFRQIRTADISTQSVSVRPNQTDITKEGTKGTQPLDSTTQSLVDQVMKTP